jgi:hypothetical protein
VRKSGRQVPAGYLRWAATGLGLVVLSVALAVVVSALGLFGFGSAAGDTGTRVSARVTTDSPCNRPTTFEIVSFRFEGEDREARLDGCGHARGEIVDILLPPGPVVDSMVVQSAGSEVDSSGPGKGLRLVLLVASGLAGAVYAFLVRRGSKRRPLPRALRLVS